MSRKIFTIGALAVLMLLGSVAQATVYRVNNAPGVDADYTSVSAAVSAASAGDTLYVEGSNTSYGSITLSKRLIIVGPGYFLTVNDSTQALKQPAQVTNIYFNSGSDGSVLYGMHITSRIDINVDSVSIYRNRVNSNYSGNVIDIQSSLRDIVIAQNWLHSTYTSNRLIWISDNCSGIFFANNWISQDQNSEFGLNYSCSSNSYMAIEDQYSNSEVTYLNNVVRGNWECDGSLLINNIHVAGCGYYDGSTVFFNNLMHSSNFPAVGGNIQNVTMSTVFERVGVNWYSDDNWWKLATGSPAEGAGVNGGDCGMFGGGLSYKLSGMPPIPAIFEADVPATANKTNGMQIEVKSMSHK